MSGAPSVSGFQDLEIQKILTKYFKPRPQQPSPPQPPQQPSPPQPLPSGTQIVDIVLYNTFLPKDEENSEGNSEGTSDGKAWRYIMAMLDPEFLLKLMKDPNVSPKHKEVATLLLLVLASECICEQKSNRAKEILVDLDVVKISTDHWPYTCKTDAILDQMYSDAIRLSENHKCTECVAVPNLGDFAERKSCSKYICAKCLHFADGRDTVHEEEGGTHACPAMQKTMAWVNMVRPFVFLARDVVHSSEYRHVSEDFTRLLDVWRCSYCFWALPMLFTAKKSLKYLQNALGILKDQTGCTDVIWRHVSLLLHMQKVLQMKVNTPLKGELLDENRKTLAEFQEKYGRFLPPLSSPPLPSLSQ